MRSIITFLLCTLVAGAARAQTFLSNFDANDTAFATHFFMDTTHQNNIWQVGAPHKTLFTSAYSAPNVLVTDTVNPYPVNDTSVFVVKFLSHLPVGNCVIDNIQFQYQLDIDSTETAMVEISKDSGQSWLNVTSLDTPNAAEYYIKPLALSSVWTHYNLHFIDPWSFDGTFYMRFTFISDSVNKNKDGWEIDNFWFDYICEGAVKEIRSVYQTDAYPNPSKGTVYLKEAPEINSVISVYSIEGRKVYEVAAKGSNRIDLPLAQGQYIIKYMTKEGTNVSRVVIEQ